MAVVGSAEIIVRAITSKVKDDIQRAFKDARPAIQAEGRAAAKDYAGAFGQTVKQQLDKELKGAIKSASSGAGEEIDKELTPAARRAARNAGDEIENGLSRAGRRAGRAAGSGFASIFAADLRGAINRFMNLASILDLLGPAIANLVAGISGAISGLYAMAAAAGQAVGALAVLPGIIGVVLQAFGAIRLAFGGVGEAISAGAKAQEAATGASTAAASAGKAATRSAATAEAAARRVQKAEDALRAAQEEAKKAQDALNKARDRAGEGAEEQQNAEAALAAAIQKRNEILSDPNASTTDVAAAQKAVDDAKRAADDIASAREKAQKRLRRAEERNDAAQRKLSKAQAARDRASKAGQKAANVGGISTPAIKAAQAYQEALSKLTPEAQRFVEEVLKMKASFKEVGNAIATELFPPLTQALQLIGDSSFFSILKKNLSDTGGIVGQIGLDFAKAFTADANMGRFSKFLAENNEILKVLRTRTSDGVKPTESLVNVILKLGRAIQPITKRFVKWGAEMLTTWDKAHGVRDLQRWFRGAGDTAAQLGDIFKHLWHSLRTLSDASSESGHGLLDSFEGATKSLDKFLKKINKVEEGQKKSQLQKYFEGAADNLRSMGIVANAIGKEFFQLGDNKGPKKATDSVVEAIEKFGEIGDKLTSGGVGKSLGELTNSVADLMNNLTQTGQTETFINTLDDITKSIKFLVKQFNKIPFAKYILGIVAVNRAFSFSAKILNLSNTFNRLKSVLIKTPLKNFASGLGGIAKKIPGVSKIGDVFKKWGKSIADSGIGKKIKGIFTNKDANKAEDAAEKEGKSVGQHMAEGMAKGLKEHMHIVRGAVDDIVDTMIETLNAGAELMDDVGKEISQGLAQGIRAHSAGVRDASSDLGQAVIDAIRTELDSHSPSRVMDSIGEDTGEGFINGLRGEIDDARRAGADLAGAAADGAKGEAITAKVTGATDGGVAAVGGTLDSGDKKVNRLTGSVGKLGGATKKIGGAFKGLGSGLLGLAGGPIGLLLAAIPLVITAFTTLYKKSPEFKKFIDGIVNAVMPIVKAIGGWLLGVLNKLFGWVNSKMPAIKKFFGDVFSAIGGFIQKHFVPVWENVLLPALKKFWDIIKSTIPVIKKIFGALFSAIKMYITKVFIPIWKAVFAIIKKLLSIVKSVFNIVWNVIKGVFNAIKDIWNKILKPVFTGIWSTVKTVFGKVQDIWDGFKKAFGKVGDVISRIGDGIKSAFEKIRDAAKKPIKWVIDTVWNNGLVKLANKIPGVNADGWTVNTSGWAKGGWTGPGAKYDVAGLVHRDEFVIKKSARRAFESAYPGFLDFINRYGKMPRGHAEGGRTSSAYPAHTPRLGTGLSGIPGFSLGGWAKGVWEGTKNVVIGGVKWTQEKAKALYDAIKDAANYLRSLPGMIAANLNNSEWGRTVIGFPRAAANKLVDFLNDKIPNGIPGISDNPFGVPFPGYEFRANGGRVRKGLPYVVGELRPELFVPDSSGTILPNLGALAGGDTLQTIIETLEKMGDAEALSQMTVNSNGGPRTLNVNINNPRQERASQSVTKAVRSKAVAAGWSV